MTEQEIIDVENAFTHLNNELLKMSLNQRVISMENILRKYQPEIFKEYDAEVRDTLLADESYVYISREVTKAAASLSALHQRVQKQGEA